jgi:hypothetical protein
MNTTNEKSSVTLHPITLFGGKLVTVSFEPTEAEMKTWEGRNVSGPENGDGGTPSLPRTEQVRVRQIPIRDYERGFALVHDEIALAGFLCGKDRAWALTLAPQSYELVLAAGKEVNEKGFFAFAGRRAAELAEKEQAAMVVGLQIAQEHPELLEKAMRNAGPAWSGPSLASPPRPAA